MSGYIARRRNLIIQTTSNCLDSPSHSFDPREPALSQIISRCVSGVTTDYGSIPIESLDAAVFCEESGNCRGV